MTATLVRSEIGTVGIAPGTLLLNTTDDFATITTAGYIQRIGQATSAYPKPTDFVFVNYSGGNGLFTISNSAGVFTLVSDGSPVITPTKANHIATYTNTAGTLSEDAATAINGGNIQAGLSGTAGTLASFPATASKGSLKIAAVANTGDTVTTLSNVAMGQATTISFPDPANAAARALIAATATPFTTGHLIASSGTGGLTVDSGITTASVATYSGATVVGNVVKASSIAGQIADAGFAVKANTTAAYAGGGTSNAYTATGLTSSSIVTAVILASTNAVAIAKAVPSSNTLTVTFTADPGANTTVSWHAITPAV